MNKFVVALNNGNREKRNAITALFQAKGWNLWHHMEDVWLITNVPENITSRAISEEISKITLIGESTKIVIKIPPGAATYWGNAAQEGWKWMEEFWGPPG